MSNPSHRISSGQVISIIEPVASGHRFVYVEMLATAALSRGLDVVVSTAHENIENEVINRLRDWPAFSVQGMDWTEGRSRGGLILQQLSAWKRVRRQSRMVEMRHGDVVHFVPYADYFIYAVGLLGSPFRNSPWGGIVMRPTFHFKYSKIVAPAKRTDRVKRYLFAQATHAKGMTRLFTIDPFLSQFIRGSSGSANTVSYVPDPAGHIDPIDRELARIRLGVAPNAAVVSIYGAINDRKGLTTLIDALRSMSDEIVLVSAGVHDVQAIDLINRYRGEGHDVIVMDRFVSHREEAEILSATDVMWLGYDKHYGMSGVLVKASGYGVPVVACPEGLIGRLTDDNALGVVLSSRGPKAVSAAINQAIRMARDPSFRSGRFAELHTVEAFVQPILSELTLRGASSGV